MFSQQKLGFIGSGRMAQAMIGGLVERQVVAPGQILCTSADDGTGEATAARFGVSFTPELEPLLAACDTLVLAIKPQQLADLPANIAELTDGRLVLSILAGAPLRTLTHRFASARNVVRAMPNTPGQIGRGITVFAPVVALGEADRAIVEGILGALGTIIEAEESSLDAVTGVSGSGPAYLFEFVAALRDGGIAAGLPPETAYQLALQTVRGAAELLHQVPASPEQHRDWVSSPGGTTLAGLAVMREGNFRETLKQTVLAATRRSRELAAGK